MPTTWAPKGDLPPFREKTSARVADQIPPDTMAELDSRMAAAMGGDETGQTPAGEVINVSGRIARPTEQRNTAIVMYRLDHLTGDFG